MAGGVVRTQAEHAGDDLGPEPGRWMQACSCGCVVEDPGLGGEAERSDELCVELSDRHRRLRVRHLFRRLLGQAGYEVLQLRAREGVVRAERGDAARHQAVCDDDSDLGLGPRPLRPGRERARRDREADEQA